MLHRAGKIPFAEELGAAYFCVMDPKTPTGVKALLLAALAYFVLPFDFLPAFFIALGLASDAAIVVGAVRMVSRHIKPEHYRQSRAGKQRRTPDHVVEIGRGLRDLEVGWSRFMSACAGREAHRSQQQEREKRPTDQ